MGPFSVNTKKKNPMISPCHIKKNDIRCDVNCIAATYFGGHVISLLFFK
jgi:hypothetical protein